MTSTIQDVADVVTRHVGADRVWRTGDPGFARARRVWNAAVTARPALVVRVRGAADVAVAVRAAREAGMPLSVRGGGHDWAGRALRENGLVLDLSGLRRVQVDGTTAVAGGGARAADVVAAAVAHGMVAPSGSVGDVGVGGLTLGGGYGPLIGRIGLASDNLLGAEVVLPDGRVVDTDDDPDLLWALRGGGGNFGVVTRLRLRLRPAETLIGGMVAFPWAQARAVLAGFDALAPRDELTVQVDMVTGPDGPLVSLSPTWFGDAAAGAAAVDEVVALGTTVLNQVGPLSQTDLVAQYDPFLPVDPHVTMRTRTLARLGDAGINDVVAAVETRTSPQSMVILHAFHGAAARVPADATAFGERAPHLLVEIAAAWDGGDPAPHVAWADALAAVLDRHALPGGYANLLGPDEPARAALAYGPNADRLRALKRRYDPDGVLSAIPLPG